MTAKLPSRWQRKKDVRPGEILDAALELFVEKGFRATKMEDIARAAGVTKGTPYLYFQNKEDIFKAVVRESLVNELSDLSQLAARHEGDVSSLLALLMEVWWARIGSTRGAGLCKLMMAEAANFPELATFYYQEVILRGRTMVADLIRLGMARGEFRAVPVESAVDTLMAPLIASMVWDHSFGCILQAGEDADPSRRLAVALDLILYGLKNNNTPEEN